MFSVAIKPIILSIILLNGIMVNAMVTFCEMTNKDRNAVFVLRTHSRQKRSSLSSYLKIVQ
jgi:hypothetical protein